MSSKTAKHAKKMERKRAIKLARRNRYAALAGTSRRKKRQSSNNKKSSSGWSSHSVQDCGNPGCKRCNPALNVGSFGKKTDRISRQQQVSANG
jgi:hypothetical protein